MKGEKIKSGSARIRLRQVLELVRFFLDIMTLGVL